MNDEKQVAIRKLKYALARFREINVLLSAFEKCRNEIGDREVLAKIANEFAWKGGNELDAAIVMLFGEGIDSE